MRSNRLNKAIDLMALTVIWFTISPAVLGQNNVKSMDLSVVREEILSQQSISLTSYFKTRLLPPSPSFGVTGRL